MKFRYIVGVVVALAGGATFAQAPRASSIETIAAALNQRVDLVEWDGAAFQEVLSWLRERGVVNVIVRWRAVEAVGVDRDSPVTLSLRDATVRGILTEVLAQLGSGEPDSDPLQFHALGNTLTISTRSEFNRQLYVRVYDVADLIRRVTDFTDGPTVELNQTQGGQSGQGQSIFSGSGSGNDPGGNEPGGAQGRTADDPEMLRLINVIKTSIEPDTWEIPSDPAWGGAHGGGKGTIVPFNRLLVVRNTIEVHEKLAGIFQ
jgi:hypothetical protein